MADGPQGKRALVSYPSILLAAFLWLAGLAVDGSAFAGNEPEKAQRRTEEDVLPKVVAVCGVPLSVKYDGDSLRKTNKDIGYDQTDGESECNEPLRYLWYACKTDAGKAAVKAARVSKIVCKGVAGPTGALTLSAGTMTVERAFEEKQPYVRSRKQFEALLKVSLKMGPHGTDDPYTDQDWHQLAQQPNPVTSTTTYCLVNGEKVAFDQNAHDSISRRKQDGKVKCWRDGVVVIDLDIRKGQKNGFSTTLQDANSRRTAYRDDKAHGEQKVIEKGKLKSLASYDNGERVWEKEFHPSGKLASYSRKFADGFAELTQHEDGKVYRLRCLPAARDDKELRKLCGFEGATTTPIYDGTGKVSHIDTWKDGVIQKQSAGTSDYAERSDVAFAEGKKNGVERVLTKDGKLGSIITWNRGVKDGKEIVYAEDGKRIAIEIVWKSGEMKERTELYLNGNPKVRETYDGRKREQRKQFWDTGKVSREGELVACEPSRAVYLSPDWCEEGVHKSYYESGAPESETTFRLGKRQGPNKSWWESGRPASVEEYVDDKCTKAKRWDKDGKLISDEEYEADGSRKLKR